MAYRVKTPWILRNVLYSRLVWKMPVTEQPCVYLTFDDGPHPTATPFVLQQLEQYNAKATFFCIGKNVAAHPDIYAELIAQGHTVGNHTHNHLNGWHTIDEQYLNDIQAAEQYIDSNIFRPPYGRIKRKQINALLKRPKPYTIYMWDVLSADFDTTITPYQCMENVIKHTEPGSIVVFHDSQKAWDRMSYTLPKVLEHCAANNWQVKALPYNK